MIHPFIQIALILPNAPPANSFLLHNQLSMVQSIVLHSASRQPLFF